MQLVIFLCNDQLPRETFNCQSSEPTLSQSQLVTNNKATVKRETSQWSKWLRETRGNSAHRQPASQLPVCKDTARHRLGSWQ